MSKPALFLEHWTGINAERMTRYESMYQWSTAAEAFYRAADIGDGQVVADFGCRPGHTAIEFARGVGPTGHVHALDGRLPATSASALGPLDAFIRW